MCRVVSDNGLGSIFVPRYIISFYYYYIRIFSTLLFSFLLYYFQISSYERKSIFHFICIISLCTIFLFLNSLLHQSVTNCDSRKLVRYNLEISFRKPQLVTPWWQKAVPFEILDKINNIYSFHCLAFSHSYFHYNEVFWSHKFLLYRQQVLIGNNFT